MNIYLDSKYHPHINIGVLLDSWINKDCFIDTGFTGGLILPKILHTKFKEYSSSYQDVELGDGSVITTEVYKVKVKYKNIEKFVSLMFTKGDDALVGIEFLTGFKFILDLKKFSISLE